MSAAPTTAAETAARAAGWTEGNGFIFLAKDWDSWKQAVSWTGEDGWPDSNVYESWEACCEAEGIGAAKDDAIMDRCNCCGRREPIDELDAKPTMTFWLRFISALCGQVFMLRYAANRGYDFDQLECRACYGAGYVSASAVETRQ